MSRPLVAFALVLFAAGSFAQTTEADVRGVYKQMNALFAKRDAKGLVALFDKTAASDFVSVMGKEKMGRAQFMKNLKKGFQVKDFPLVQTKVLMSRASGSTVTLSVQWSVKGKGPGGKPYAMQSVAVDTWAKTPKGYRLKRMYEEKPPQPVKL